MKELYSPRNEVELAVLKSLLDSEEIGYFVRNDDFGLTEVLPLPIFNSNQKTILVDNDQFDEAKEILDDYLSKIEAESPPEEDDE